MKLAFLAFLLASVHAGADSVGDHWMTSLDSKLRLSQVSIPGSHDSMAFFEPLPGTAKCQDLSLADQLNAGVRFLDIRCRHVNDRFAIYHGSIDQKADFNDVLKTVVGFLEDHPSECLILSVKEESTANGNTRSFEETFDSYVAKNPGKWNLAAGIPTVHSAKGKITLLRRFAAKSSLGIDASAWKDDASFTSGLLNVQDNYLISDIGSKWAQIASQFDKARTSTDSMLSLNFCSGYQTNWLGVPNISTVAKDINSRLCNELATARSRKLGVVIMDFVDANRCELVYGVNGNK